MRAGIPKGSNQGVHALRHTFASNLFRSGEDPKVVSELLGHSEIGITMPDLIIHGLVLIQPTSKEAEEIKIRIVSKRGSTTIEWNENTIRNKNGNR